MTQPSSVIVKREDESSRTTPVIHPSALSSAPASGTSPAKSASWVVVEACRLLLPDFFAFRPELVLPEDRKRSTISRVFELRERDVGEPSVRNAGRNAAEARRGVVLRVLPKLCVAPGTASSASSATSM